MREWLSMKNTIKMTVIFGVLIVAGGSAYGQQGTGSASKPATAANSQQAAATKPKTPATAAKPAAKPGPTDAAKKSETLELKTDKDKASYALGLNIGEGLKKESEDLDAAVVQRGMQDALAGNKPLMTDEEAKSAWTTFQVNMRKKQQEKLQELAETNKKESDTFLAENKAKEGVVALPSGLQYKIVTQGTGPKPTATDTVVCNYKGTLIDGTVFDSSYNRGPAHDQVEPATFPVNGVIKGWTEALQLMPVGSKWQLFVPPDLAYGAQGNRGIAPNSTLIFDVELISIKPGEPPKDAAQPANPGAQPAGGTQPESNKDPNK